MNTVPQAGPWWPAVGAPLERGVRQRRKHLAALHQSQRLSAWAEHPQRGGVASIQSVSATCQAAHAYCVRAREASNDAAAFYRYSAVHRLAVPRRGVRSGPSAWCPCHGVRTVNGLLKLLQESVPRSGPQRAAAGGWWRSPRGEVICLTPRQCPPGAALPNPSFKPSTNGVPRGPGWRYAVHFRHPGPRITPLVPA